jgi:hypothetical protein
MSGFIALLLVHNNVARRTRCSKPAHERTVADQSPAAARHASAKLLGKSDNDALRPTNVGQLVRVLVPYFANDLGSVRTHARNDIIDAIDGKHYAKESQRIHGPVHRPKPDHVRRVKLVQLNTLPIGSSQHCDGSPNILEPDQASDSRPFDYRLALEPEAQFDEESLNRFEIVDNDENVVHAFNRHIFLSLASVMMLVVAEPSL